MKSSVEIEEKILDAIGKEVLHPRSIRRIVDLVNDKLKEVIPRIEGIRESLVRVSEKLEIEINNLVQAVAEGGNNSEHLVDAIKRKESELADVCSKLEATNDKKPLGELKIDTQYALKWMKNLGELMKVDVIRARDGIAKILGTLTATPTTHNGVPGMLLVGRPRLEGILGIVSASSTSNGSGGRI